MEKPDFEKSKNTQESFLEVLITPKEEFASKRTPTFESDILDKKSGEKIGHVTFQLNHSEKFLVVQDVIITQPKQGYGVSLYKLLQLTYPEYQLKSSESMFAKGNESQEKPNAVYLWEKLVQLGLAEQNDKGGFFMKTNNQQRI